MKIVFYLFVCCLCATVTAQQAKDAAVLLQATTVESPASITLNWPLDNTCTGYKVFRKQGATTEWGTALASLPASATSYADNAVSVGKQYEYYVQRLYSVNTQLAHGYISAGIKVPAVYKQGVLLVLINQLDVEQQASKIEQLINDCRGDGWLVRSEVVAANATVAQVKQRIAAHAANSSAPLQSVLLVGHIAVPYSGGFKAEQGNIYPPDGHSDHGGAWPADMYYGSFDESIWSDVLVNDVTPARTQNQNIPGDGKFDQMYVGDNKISIQIGRIDVSNMPSFGSSDSALLANYLDKLHAYKTGKTVVVNKGLIDDNWGYMSGEAFSAAAWRDFATMFGDSIETTDYITSTKQQCYAFTWGGGAGTYTSAGGIGNTQSFTNDSVQQIFTMLFGSYFGDWDSENNFLRAPLASRNGGLTSVWSGRPHWHFHHMSLGQTIGYATQLTQNNYHENSATPFGYVYNSSPTFVHIALMGDPSLRMHMRKGVERLTLSTTPDSLQVKLTWNKVADAIGYYVLRTNNLNFGFDSLTILSANDTSFTDATPFGGYCKYMVRAVYLQQTPSGSYYNLGIGLLDSVFTKSTVGVNELANNGSINCAVYPNPTTGPISLVLEGRNASVEVYDISGRLLQQMEHYQSLQTIDLGVYGKGYYVVKVKTEQGIAVKKVVVQ
jgi:hypothetical protein